METVYYTRMDSPLGALLLAGNEQGLQRVNFLAGTRPLQPLAEWVARDAAFGEASRQLAAYFAGELRQFDLALAPRGSVFQRQVWRALREIPYGRTVSYGELARRIGRPTASRAVGAANGRNPLPIVVPCHRVVGGTGKLTGFYGGLHLKEALLRLEGCHCPAAPAQTVLL